MLEYEANGQRKPGQHYVLDPVVSPEALQLVRQKKRDLKVLVDDRRRLGATSPWDAEIWWLTWEQHPWEPLYATYWRQWDSYVPDQGERFYTTSAAERDNAIANLGYASEGIACYVCDTPVAGTTVELFRLVHKTSGHHFYTTSQSESASAQKIGYQFEMVACNVYDAGYKGGIPLLRLWNNIDHLYTTSIAERDFVISPLLGYAEEAIACRVLDSEAPGTAPLYRLVKLVG